MSPSLAGCVWLFWNYNIIAVSTSRWGLTNTRLTQAWPPLTTSYSAELRKFIVIFLSTSPHCSVSCLDIFTSHIYSDLLNLSALRWQAGPALSKYENFMFQENQIRWAACRSTALPHSRLFFSPRQSSESEVRWGLPGNLATGSQACNLVNMVDPLNYVGQHTWLSYGCPPKSRCK